MADERTNKKPSEEAFLELARRFRESEELDLELGEKLGQAIFGGPDTNPRQKATPRKES